MAPRYVKKILEFSQRENFMKFTINSSTEADLMELFNSKSIQTMDA
jgi:hypothetical protein